MRDYGDNLIDTVSFLNAGNELVAVTRIKPDRSEATEIGLIHVPTHALPLTEDTIIRLQREDGSEIVFCVGDIRRIKQTGWAARIIWPFE